MDELELLQQAVGLAKAGRKEEAREVLTRILRSNPNQEYAWLWMTTVVETDDRRIYCFKKVLEINPNNAHARQGLQELQSRPGLIPDAVRCPTCGFVNRPEARFCSGCGKELAMSAPQPRSSMGGTLGEKVSPRTPLSAPKAKSTEPSARRGSKGLGIVMGLICVVVLIVILSNLIGPKSRLLGTWESCALLGCTTWIFKPDGTLRAIGTFADEVGQYRFVDQNHIEVTWGPGVYGGPRGVCEVEPAGNTLILRCEDFTWTFEKK